IYYGDEIGMEGGPDPDCRRCMEWDPEKWDAPTLDLHRRLVHARRERPWLSDGLWETLVADPISGAYAYRRSSRRMLGALPGPDPEQSLWVALNSSPAPIELALRLDAARSMRVRDLLTDERWKPADLLPLALPPYGAV